MKFKSQICTTKEQSNRLLSLGLKKETADMCWIEEWGYDDDKQVTFATGNYFVRPIDYVWDDKYVDYIPAWSLHRLIEILDTNPCVFYTNCGYDNIIDRIEDYIKEGLTDTRYLEEWCLDEEE